MLQDGLQFRAEIDVVAAAVVVERLDAHAVARQHQALARLGPEGHGEHSAQPRETGRVPLQERVQHRLGVAVANGSDGRRPSSSAPQFPMVVDLAVEDDDRVAIVADDRLIAAVEVDDLEAHGAQRRLAAFEDALLVGTAMDTALP